MKLLIPIKVQVYILIIISRIPIQVAISKLVVNTILYGHQK